IQADGGVALAEDEAVAVGPVRLVRPVPQLGVIERREQLGRGEGARVVAGTRDPREPYRLEPDELRPVAQALDQLLPLRRPSRRVLRARAHSAAMLYIGRSIINEDRFAEDRRPCGSPRGARRGDVESEGAGREGRLAYS